MLFDLSPYYGSFLSMPQDPVYIFECTGKKIWKIENGHLFCSFPDCQFQGKAHEARLLAFGKTFGF